MRTPEDILKAQATYNDNLIKTELSALPEGYIQGGTLDITLSDVIVNPLLANIKGKRIAKPSTNVADMDWQDIKRNDTRYYIYLNRYGFWFVNINVPITIDGKYGKYKPESNERYIGEFYVNSVGNYVTTELIGIQIIGYSGEGSNKEPKEGDRRVYIDDDEIDFEEYTGGVWTTVNSIKLGGVDSNSLFYPFLQCRGVLNPLASGIDTEFFPSNNFSVYNFENVLTDQNGDNILYVQNTVYTVSKKFGLFALTTDDTADSSYIGYPTLSYDLTNTNFNIGYWIDPTLFVDTTGTTHKRLILRILVTPSPVVDTFYSFNIMRNNDNTLSLIEGTFGLAGYDEEYGNIVIHGTTTQKISLNTYFYLALNWDYATTTLSLVLNDEVINMTNTGLEALNLSVIRIFLESPHDEAGGADGNKYIIDELLFSIEDTVNTDLLVQHYNHNVPWNTNFSAKDIILKPADGGRVIAGNTSLIISPKVIDLTSADVTYTLPAGSGNGFVQDIFWSNGGTYKLTFGANGTETIGGLTPSTWLGEGEGSMTVIYDSANNDWKVREYEDSYGDSAKGWWKYKNGVLKQWELSATLSGTATVAGGVYTAVLITWTFLLVFYAEPLVTPIARRGFGTVWNTIQSSYGSTTQCSTQLCSPYNSYTAYPGYEAIGRWRVV